VRLHQISPSMKQPLSSRRCKKSGGEVSAHSLSPSASVDLAHLSRRLAIRGYYRERGLLKATTIGRHLLYRRVELDRFLERQTAGNRRTVRGHFVRAGIRPTATITIHTVRKSFGQNHANTGTPIHVLQRLLGHASITTTREFYLQAADANERDAVARYEALLDTPAKQTCVRNAYPPDSGRPGEPSDSASHAQQRV